MREMIDAAVELQITGLEMAVATLNQADLTEDAIDAGRIYARVREGIDSILYLLSKHAITDEQNMRIEALLLHLNARLDLSANLPMTHSEHAAPQGHRSIQS